MSDLIIRDLKAYTGASTCRNYGAIADLNVETEKGNAYERAVAHKDIIREVLTGKCDISEVADLVDQGIESMYSLEETNKAAKQKETENLVRYLSNEHRTPHFVSKEVIEIGHDNIGIACKPDALFIDSANREVEAVIYRSGSPSINQRTGIKADKVENMKEWFKLWVLKQYAYGYALKHLSLKKGDVFTAKASYYFMKKSTDNKAPRDNDFFSGMGGNIVFLEDKYKFGETVCATSDDQLFFKFIDECDAGIECTDKDCDACPAKANCKYTKAPVQLAKKSLKKRGKITPSPEQQAVIDAIEGIYKVNATAGSGKTECMTERTKRLIMGGINPRSILHISFTEAAVGEMKDRIVGKCLAEGKKITKEDIECYTFNAFANKAIGRYYSELGFTKAPAILTAEFEMDIIEKLINETPISGIDAGSVKFTGGSTGQAIPLVIYIAQTLFQLVKSHRLDPDDPDTKDELIPLMREKGYYKSMSDQSILELLDMYKKYNAMLREDNFVTYADQEPLMFKVLELHPEYFDNLGYTHIVVDEFQDSNEIQVETIKKLTDTKTFKSLMVVGDDSQAIYAFRETTPEYIINFDKYIGKPVTELFLSTNRRSTPEIVSLANEINNLNANKVDKDMIATRESGKKPVIRGFYSKKEELEYIVEGIKSKIKEGVPYEDICYIASKRPELAEMGTLLTKAGIPWVMKSPMSLMENSRIIGALSLADAFYQPDATVLYFNYLAARYDGEILNLYTPEEINVMIADMKAQFESIYLLEMDEQRAIFHNYLELIRKNVDDELYNYFLDLLYQNEDFPSELEYTRIFKKYGSKLDKKMDQSYEGVVLTTAHSSKGLEWPVVYVSITNFDGESYHKKGKRADARVEERRRLLFVATTRARDEIYITGQYVAFGPKDDRTYNQFLRELYSISGQDYQPVDPMEAIRDAERKEKNREKARERYAQKKNATLFDLSGNASSKPMTDEQKAKYNALVKGAKQMSLPL